MNKMIGILVVMGTLLYSIFVLPLSAEQGNMLPVVQSEQTPEVLANKLRTLSPAVKFDDKYTIKKGIKNTAVEFTMPSQENSFTLEPGQEGFLFGKFVTTGNWFLGTLSTAQITAGRYLFWVVKQGASWKVFVTNEKGDIISSTDEVNVVEDKATASAMKNGTVLLPKYSLAAPEGKLTILADAGPGTVHGCQCHTVMECGRTLSGLTLCIPTRVCSCWN